MAAAALVFTLLFTTNFLLHCYRFDYIFIDDYYYTYIHIYSSKTNFAAISVSIIDQTQSRRVVLRKTTLKYKHL